jgi:hypothetical protein
VYHESDLVDKKGRPIKIDTIPDRTKGNFLTDLFGTASAPVDSLFWGNRSDYSKTIIREQVYDIAEHCFKSGVDFDDDNCHWMQVHKYILPEVWHNIATTTPLLVVFPTQYPELPPIGFYMKADLQGAPDGHLFPNVYHEAAKEPLEQGWKWYCMYVRSGSWQPVRVRKSGDWKHGDNLWTYFTLIREVLASKE